MFLQSIHPSRVQVKWFKLNDSRNEKAAAAVTIALISEKNKSRKKRQKRVCMKPRLKRRKNKGIYESLLAMLEGEHNYNILLTHENLFQLIKDSMKRKH